MPVPKMILDYNQHMGGVGNLDQFRAYHDIGRAGRKWWKYIMFVLFNLAIVYDIPLGSFLTAASCYYLSSYLSHDSNISFIL